MRTWWIAWIKASAHRGRVEARTPDNTLIFYLQDNGGCAEAMGRTGTKTNRSAEPTLTSRRWRRNQISVAQAANPPPLN